MKEFPSFEQPEAELHKEKLDQEPKERAVEMYREFEKRNMEKRGLDAVSDMF